VRNKVLLLGLGNDILTDDSIGLRVAAGLREQFSGREGVTILQTTEMGLALLDIVADCSDLVLVDAVQTHKEAPGFVHELEERDLQPLSNCSPHFLGVGETLALGRKLGISVPVRVKIFAVEAADPFTVSQRLTPSLEAALPAIIERVAAYVEQVAEDRV